MNTIWKFPVPQEGEFSLDMPIGAQVLCVQTQYGEPQLWAAVSKSVDIETRNFRLAGTGHEISPGLVYIGTFQLFEGSFIGHLFEIPQHKAESEIPDSSFDNDTTGDGPF